MIDAADADGVMKNRLSSTDLEAKDSQEPEVTLPMEICIPASIRAS